MSDARKALLAARQNGVATIDRSMFMTGGDAMNEKMNQLGSTGGSILKFSGNTGTWSFKNEEFESGSRFAFNMEYVEWGFVCWKEKKIIDRALVPTFAQVPKPTEDDCPDYGPYSREGDGWSPAFRVMVRDLEDGTEYELTLSNKSGCNAMAALIKDFGDKARMHVNEDGSAKAPIIEIGSQGFETNKAAGKKYAPTFKIVDWYSTEEMAQVMGGADAVDGDDTAPDTDEGETAPANEAPASSGVKKPTGNRRPRVVS